MAFQTGSMEKKSKYAIYAYFVLRAILGLNIFMHGLVRLMSGYSDFVNSLVLQFHVTILPAELVAIFGRCLPFLELAIGFCLLIGWHTLIALFGGATLIAILVFGSTLTQTWDIVGIQMLYAAIYYILIYNYDHNKISIDYWTRQGKT
jgi:thiosulfate dehydrogenase (quinone) large subunit